MWTTSLHKAQSCLLFTAPFAALNLRWRFTSSMKYDMYGNPIAHCICFHVRSYIQWWYIIYSILDGRKILSIIELHQIFLSSVTITRFVSALNFVYHTKRIFQLIAKIPTWCRVSVTIIRAYHPAYSHHYLSPSSHHYLQCISDCLTLLSCTR